VIGDWQISPESAGHQSPASNNPHGNSF